MSYFSKTQVLGKIQDATDVLLILTPGSLDRCKNEDDWLRKEIGHAIVSKRNIVPVLARGFQMPLAHTLPSDIADLPKYHGLTAANEFFEASIDRLVATFCIRPNDLRQLQEAVFRAR